MMKQGGPVPGFVYEPLPTRVVFSIGSFDRLADEADRVGHRALVLCTPEQEALALRASSLLGGRCAGIHAGAVMHVPASTVDVAAEALARTGADTILAVGGGSTTGLAKALALRTRMPIIAVPTTYAGSEMTPIWGITDGGVKRTGRDPHVLPRTAIYDPALTLSLPPRLSGVSGLNAIAHCVEGLYSEHANPLVSIMAEEGIRAIGRSLAQVVRAPDDVGARSDVLYGAWLAGVVLGSVGMALHHKLCHTLGGTFGLPHAETHAVVLPHAAAYNAAAAPLAMARVARALDAPDGPTALYDLLLAVGAPAGLKDLGMPREGLSTVVDLALTNPYYNPAPLDGDRLMRLLGDAFEGRAPESEPALAMAGA